MKKTYSVAAKFVRWAVVGILSVVIAIPAIVSLVTYTQDRSDRSIKVSYGQSHLS